MYFRGGTPGNYKLYLIAMLALKRMVTKDTFTISAWAMASNEALKTEISGQTPLDDILYDKL